MVLDISDKKQDIAMTLSGGHCILQSAYNYKHILFTFSWLH